MGLILLSHSSQLYFKNPFCKPGWNCIDPQPLTLQNSIKSECTEKSSKPWPQRKT